jgi:flagellar biosynthesis/type III secretory pathway ATPase
MLSPEEDDEEDGGVGKSALLGEIARHLTDRRVITNLLEEGLEM